MLWLQNVPDFEYIYIHTGNTDHDSAGCILVGYANYLNIDERGSVGMSVDAYKDIYPPIAQKIANGEDGLCK